MKKSRGLKLKIGSQVIRIYARHVPTCPQKDDHSEAATCRCIRYAQYQEGGKQKRVSTDAWTFNDAKTAVLTQFGKRPVADATGTTVVAAITRYMAWREREKGSNKKHEIMTGKLRDFCAAKGIGFLRDVTTANMSDFKASLRYKNHKQNSSSMKVHWCVMGAFFDWCMGDGLLDKSPVPSGPQHVTKGGQPEVEPFSDAEMAKTLAAPDKIPHWNAELRQRMRVLCLLMRWSGLAKADAARLPRAKLKDGRVITNRKKTKGDVYVRLPEFVAKALEALPCPTNPDYFFWTLGTKGQVLTEKKLAQHYGKLFQTLFEASGVVRGHSHRFRHTFITRCCAAGMSVEDVADCAGNSPAEIRKTYKHWIVEAQQRLDEETSLAWVRMGLDAMGNPITTSVQ